MQYEMPAIEPLRIEEKLRQGVIQQVGVWTLSDQVDPSLVKHGKKGTDNPERLKKERRGFENREEHEAKQMEMSMKEGLLGLLRVLEGRNMD